jgi:hypothetical protein
MVHGTSGVLHVTWLLEQGEHLPVILAAIVVTIGICRIMFSPRGDLQALAVKIEELQRDDERHMGSVTRAHIRVDEFTRDVTKRVDEWTGSVHSDLVRLFELSHDHEHRKDGEGGIV